MLDLLISSASIVDGTGAPAFDGSVAVEGDRISLLVREPGPPLAAARSIDARGHVLAPGFVDVHNHSDLAPLVEPEMRSVVRQGVTTVVVGNCGSSPWPVAGAAEAAELVGLEELDVTWRTFGEYLEAMQARLPAANIAPLVGHGAVRMQVMGLERRDPSDEEMAAMRTLVAAAMADGAVGMSTGLIYVPGMFSSTDEIAALASESARSGGIYASHIRGEGEHLFRAIDEAIEVGRRAGLAAHVSHLKCETSLIWGRADELLERIHGADDVTADQYPYTAWNSSLASLLPPWAAVEEVGQIARSDWERLRRAVEEGEPDFQSSVKGTGWDRIVIMKTASRRWNGSSVAGIAEEMGMAPFHAMVSLLEEDPLTSCIGHAMREDDVRAIAADPEIFVASDGSAMSPEGPYAGVPVHPREYGTFPRVLAKYARKERLLSLEEAVRKMTSLPAGRFGLRDRGIVREGAFADLVLFDPAGIEDTSTFDAPHAFPKGIDLVVVNGHVAFDGSGTGDRAGRVLPRS